VRIAILGSDPRYLVSFRGELIRVLRQRGHQVLAFANEHDPQADAELRALGAEPIVYRMNRGGTNLLEEIGTLAALTRLLRRHRPDATLGYSLKLVIYGSLAAAAAGVPRRFSLISGLGSAFIDVERPGRRALNLAARALLRAALARNQLVFFQNADDLDELQRGGALPAAVATCLVAGSGVDLQHFAARPVCTDPVVFLFAGRLQREKGVSELAEAARLLRPRWPSARFRILGPLDAHPEAIGPSELEAWRREGVLEYLGQARDVRPFLEAASVAVLPSYREGTPRYVLEAMAMGRPVVTTDVPGCRQTVLPGLTGYLAAPRDARSLANAMQHFLAEPGLIARMGARARQLAEQRFDARAVARTMADAIGS
jgi:glycosyltransferase involved in cell wall biosynthesis